MNWRKSKQSWDSVRKGCCYLSDRYYGGQSVDCWICGVGGTAPRTAVAGANSYDNIPAGLPSGFWTHAVDGGPYAHTITLLQDGGGNRDDRHLIIPSSNTGKIAIRWDAGQTKSYQYFYTDKNKPTAADVGAVPSGRKVNGHALSADINVTSQDIFNGQAIGLSTEDLDTLKTPGIYYQPANANTSTARHYPKITPER